MKKLLIGLSLVLPTLAAQAGTEVDFDQIVHWAGEGENRAALIIQFNDEKSDAAYVWGYRWDGTATGEDMLRAVARASRCLTPLIQYTGAMGSTLDGIGLSDGREEFCANLVYDFAGAVNGSSFDFYNPNVMLGQTEAPGDAAEQMCIDAIQRAIETGVIEHPINARKYGYPSYDYDFWQLSEDYKDAYEFRWQAGWYNGYWSYWVGGEGDTTDDLSYSGLGMSSRQLVNGSIDLWNYNTDMNRFEESAAPSDILDYEIADYAEVMTEPDPIVYPVDFSKLACSVGSGEKFASVVFQFNDAKGTDNLAYEYRWSGGWDDRLSTVLENCAKADKRLTITTSGNGIANVSFDKNYNGRIDEDEHDGTSGEWQIYAYYANEPECMKVGLDHFANPRAVIVVTRRDNSDDTEYPALNDITYLNKPWDVDITFPCVAEDGNIHLNPRHMAGLYPEITPVDAATWKNVDVKISGNGKFGDDDYLASIYKVNYWNPSRMQFYELQAYRPGECTVTVTLTNPNDNNESFQKDFNVIIENPDTSIPVDYSEGTIILNEEWFGHTNGGLNYITPDNEIIYQAYTRENPGKAFGCTSQHGTIWNDLLIVASKQNADKGDPLPGGGRLVIADANTLKYRGSLDVLEFDGEGGDGRAVCGATPEKIYVSTSNGIYIVNIANPETPEITGKISGTESGASSLYSGQCGDMVNIGKYVVALKQSYGLIFIDTESDEVVKTIENSSIQGITQIGDGTLYYAATVKDADNKNCSMFVPVNPETLEEGEGIQMPAELGTVSCGWGAWRSTAFYGSPSDNDIWFTPGAASIAGGGANYIRWHAGDDPSELKPFFTLTDVTGTTEFGEEVGQSAYGTARYDYRNNRLIVMTTRKGAASGGYRDHWIHLVDGETGDITKTIQLEPYYWFQSLPIFPDVEEPRLKDDVASIVVSGGMDMTVNLRDIITDPDNYDSNISYSLADDGASSNVEAVLNGSELTLKAVSDGQTNVLVNTVSNGRRSVVSIPVTVDKTSGIDNVMGSDRSIEVRGNRVFINGYNGSAFVLSDLSGRVVASFTVDADEYVAVFDVTAGIYVLNSDKVSVKVMIK